MRSLTQSIHPSIANNTDKKQDQAIEELKVEVQNLDKRLSEEEKSTRLAKDFFKTEGLRVETRLETDQFEANRAIIRDNAYIKKIESDMGYIENIESEDVMTHNVSSSTGSFENLTSNDIETSRLKTTDLEVENFSVSEWEGDKATILDINTDVLNVNDNLVADKADIQKLQSTSIFGNDISAVNMEAIDVGFTNAQIRHLKVLEDSDLGVVENASISHYTHYVDLPSPVSDTNFNIIELPKLLTGSYRVTFVDKETNEVMFSFTLNDTLENIYFSYSRGDNPKYLDQIAIYQGKMYLQTWFGGRLYWHSDSLETQLAPESFSDWPFDIEETPLDYPIFVASRRAATVYTNYVNLNIEDKPLGQAVLDYFYTDDYSEVEEFTRENKEFQYDPDTDLTLKTYLPDQNVNKEADVEFNSVKVKEDTVTERLTVNNGLDKQVLRKRDGSDNLVYEFPLEKVSVGGLDTESDALLTESAVALWDGSTNVTQEKIEIEVVGKSIPTNEVRLKIEEFKSLLSRFSGQFEPKEDGYYWMNGDTILHFGIYEEDGTTHSCTGFTFDGKYFITDDGLLRVEESLTLTIGEPVPVEEGNSYFIHTFDGRQYISDLEEVESFAELYENSSDLADTDGTLYYGVYKKKDLDNTDVSGIGVQLKSIIDGVATYSKDGGFSSNIQFVNRIIEGEWAAGDVYIPNNKLTAKEAEVGELSIDNLEVTGDVHIAGDLTVDGEVVTVHTEEALIKDNTITLRDGAEQGIQPGEVSGININNYDGNGTSLQLGVDSEGTLRIGTDIGTSGGNNEPILTRSESNDLEDGHILVWDAANYKAVDSGLKPEEVGKYYIILGWSEFFRLTGTETVPPDLSTFNSIIADLREATGSVIECYLPAATTVEMQCFNTTSLGVGLFHLVQTGATSSNLVEYTVRTQEGPSDKYSLKPATSTWVPDTIFNNGIIIKGSTDVGGGFDVSGKPGTLTIGDPNGLHIAVDNNEIVAKTNATTGGTLYIQDCDVQVKKGLVIPTSRPATLVNGMIWME